VLAVPFLPLVAARAAPSFRLKTRVLARAHRVTHPDEFRAAVRKGRRAPAEHAVVYRLRTDAADGPRFGVIVSKKVGGAVVRNRVRRRIQSVCADSIGTVPASDTIVIRALPGAGEIDWDTLRSEIDAGLRNAVSS
jgi:ribonuclease P protein component